MFPSFALECSPPDHFHMSGHSAIHRNNHVTLCGFLPAPLAASFAEDDAKKDGRFLVVEGFQLWATPLSASLFNVIVSIELSYSECWARLKARASLMSHLAPGISTDEVMMIYDSSLRCTPHPCRHTTDLQDLSKSIPTLFSVCRSRSAIMTWLTRACHRPRIETA